MGRVSYDHSLYRTGYRPYGKTNPFAAAHGLSGVSMPHGVFGPWRLSGLGQNPPFTRSGGYKLHGLGALGDAPIPPDSILTYQGTWTTVQDPQSIVNAVVAALNGDGQLTVLQAPASQSLSATFANLIGANEAFPVTLVLQVTNGMGFNSVNDAISIVRHYVYQVSQVMPQTDSITKIQAPGSANTPNYQAAGLLNPGNFGLPGTPGAPGAPQQTFSQWLAANGTMLAIAGLGIAALFVIRK